MRMPVFWLAVLAVLALLASAGRFAWSWSIAEQMAGSGVTVPGVIVEMQRRGGQDRSMRLWVTVEFRAGDSVHRQTLRATNALAARARSGRLRAGDRVDVRYLPDRPHVAELDGERIARPWFELPVIALILFFVAVVVLALRRDLREMRTIAETGLADVALAERVQGWGPIRRVTLREIPGTVPTGWGHSLLTGAGRARALVAQGRVGVVRRDGAMMNRMYLGSDLPPRSGPE